MPEPRPDHIQEECHDQDRRDKLHYAQPFLWVSARPCAPKRFLTRRNGGRHPPQSIMPNWLSAIILEPDTRPCTYKTVSLTRRRLDRVRAATQYVAMSGDMTTTYWFGRRTRMRARVAH